MFARTGLVTVALLAGAASAAPLSGRHDPAARTLAGNLAAEDGQRVTLRLIGQETTVANADILAREKPAVSMIPEGRLKNLTTAEVRDRIACLRTTPQVPPPN